MKNLLFILILPLVFFLNGCADNADPFRNKSDNVKQSGVKPAEEPPIPGISENAISITLLRDLDALYFEEGVEYSYEVNVRLYLPNIDFNAELVGAPEGMILELKSEFNTEVVTSPVNPGTSPVDPATPPADTTAPKPPASVANQKIYVIKWKPTFDAIPDVSISSITRFLMFKVNIGDDKQRTKEFRYSVSQATTKLKVSGFSVDPDLREGEKRGKAKVYVSYPGLQSSTKFPQVIIDTASSSTSNGCLNLPRSFVLDSAKYISDPKSPNFESIEYSYTVDLTRFDITGNSVNCNLNVSVINLGNLSDPYPVTVTVLNTIADPLTNWAENIELEFEQEKETQFYFQVYGVQNEGVLDVTFPKSCSQIFNGQGDCKCRKYSAFTDRHKIECLVEVNHKKTFGTQSYVIEFVAQMSNGSFTSRKIPFKRVIKFSPKGFSFFDVQDKEATTEEDTGNNSGGIDNDFNNTRLQ
jgi:hypothetical protein